MAAIDWIADPGMPVAVMGGSHGGFLVGHLIGQYPNRFAGAVMLNPVTDLVGNLHVSDIPDWTEVEWGSLDIPVPEKYKVLHEKSPIAHVKNVRTPTLFLIGGKDLRVPPFQGIAFYHAIPDTVSKRLRFYPDENHSIGKPATGYDCSVEALRWIKHHLFNTRAALGLTDSDKPEESPESLGSREPSPAPASDRT